jgi:hypothetical protein
MQLSFGKNSMELVLTTSFANDPCATINTTLNGKLTRMGI